MVGYSLSRQLHTQKLGTQMTHDTHVNYAPAKALKEVLGNTQPIPLEGVFEQYGKTGKIREGFDWMGEGSKAHTRHYAYQLHDLLSRPFCEAMAKIGIDGSEDYDGYMPAWGLQPIIA